MLVKMFDLFGVYGVLESFTMQFCDRVFSVLIRIITAPKQWVVVFFLCIHVYQQEF